MPKSKREKMRGHGATGKTAVVAVKDRPTKQVSAQVVSYTSGKTLRRFVLDNINPDAKVYTDDALA